MNIILNVSYMYVFIIVFTIFQCNFTYMFQVSLSPTIVDMYIYLLIYLLKVKG